MLKDQGHSSLKSHYCIVQKISTPQVFPYEYQRALKQLAEKEAASEVTPAETKVEPVVRDIEESVTDATMEKKRLEKILDKTR